MHPLGTHPLDTHPLGTHLLGPRPLGTHPLGTHPLGTLQQEHHAPTHLPARGFLSLPGELRNEIARHVLEADSPIDPLTPDKHHPWSFTLVNRQLHQDYATHWLYQHTTLLFNAPKSNDLQPLMLMLDSFIAAQTPKQLASITSLVLSLTSITHLHCPLAKALRIRLHALANLAALEVHVQAYHAIRHGWPPFVQLGLAPSLQSYAVVNPALKARLAVGKLLPGDLLEEVLLKNLNATCMGASRRLLRRDERDDALLIDGNTTTEALIGREHAR